MKFKKTLLAASLAALSMGTLAQTNDAGKDEVELAPSDSWAATANVNVVSDYRFRGIDQTFNQPAIQGGFDITMPYGFYLGNWNSNVNQNAGYSGSNIEMDLYGGWKYAFTEDWGLDTGLINYFYPGSKLTGTSNEFGASTKGGMTYNLEYYIGGNWKTVSLKQFFALTDYFNAQGFNGASTAGTGYTDLTATYDLGNLDPSLGGWGVVAHAGYLYVKNYSASNYADWKLGVTKDIGGGWTAGVSYVQTSAAGDCNNTTSPQPYCLYNNNGTSTQNAGNATGIVSIGKTF